MNIAFTGSYGTGKTTLFERLRYIYANDSHVRFGEEVARKIISRGYPLNKEANIHSYVHYINDQLASEQSIERDYHFISDRSLLDPLAFAIINQSLPRPFVPDYFVNMMQNIWLMESKNFDFYFYFPIEFPLVNDANTVLFDEEYRQEADKMIYLLLTQHNKRFITISGNLKSREKQAIEFIRDNAISKQ